jgi:hypothetical protein
MLEAQYAERGTPLPHSVFMNVGYIRTFAACGRVLTYGTLASQ